MAKLRNTEVEIMVLLFVPRTSVSLALSLSQIIATPRGQHTYTHARHVCTSFIQKGHHMSPLGDRAFDTRIEGIAGEEGEEVRLVFEAGVRPVVIDDGLETRDTADWFCGPWSE